MKTIRYFQRPVALLLLLVMAFGTLNCYSRRQMRTSRLSQINTKPLTFIAIDSSAPTTRMWALSNVKMEATALTARFDRASPALTKEIATIHKNGQNARHTDHVLIYVNPPTITAYGDTLTTRLDFAKISKVEVFKFDGGKTIGLAFAIVGGVAAVGLIALVIACSCPYVYSEGPEGNQLEGELFAGAIYPQLERADWLPLPALQPVDNQYNILIANRLFENQHTNLLELEVLDCQPGIQPLYDKYGRFHTIADALQPVSATNISGQNVLSEIQSQDGVVFRGDLENEQAEGVERLTLTFAKPAAARNAKLVVHAKNNFWLDYVYYQFQEELGVYGEKIRQKFAKKSAAQNLAWAERQKMPLAVWLETSAGKWEKVDYFNLIGPMAFKKDVLSIDLSQVQTDFVCLRLEYGFNFWEIDEVSLDFSDDVPVLHQKLEATKAITQTGEDVSTALRSDDQQYYDQPNVGDEARVSFAAPPLQPGLARHFILHAKGHYEIRHQPATGRPGLFKLKAWEQENALPRFSRECWQEARELSSNEVMSQN
ncbi:MAG: hypothetical protein IT262_12705 [Saprospiraceae bacterium]|nr:hypothetical protein [Saprospiraceae bacterium]